MFYEFTSTSREVWKYIYLGSQLLASAKSCRDRYHHLEMVARKELADLMRDVNVSQNDERIGILKRKIENNGKQYEACCVFVHEFSRASDREFHLSLGDVVFFGLVK